MHFIIYSDIDERSIRSNLGKPQYSYYFVLRSFQPVLEQLGDVTIVKQPEVEVDPIYEACAARGEPCVFFSFSPPNEVALGLKCPTVVVFAWEFSNLPDGDWAPFNPRDDWRHVLRTLGYAISLSGYTARITKRELGDDFPIFAIPGGIWNRVALPGRVPSFEPRIAARELRIRGTVVDSATVTLYPERIFEPGFPPPITEPEWEPQPVPEPEPEPSPAPDQVPEQPAMPEIAPKLPPPPAEAPEQPAPPEPEPEMPPPPTDAVPPPPPHAHNLRYVLAVSKRHVLEWYREAIRDLLPPPLRRVNSRLGIAFEATYRGLTGWRPGPPAPEATPDIAAIAQPEIALEIIAIAEAEPAPEPVPEPQAPEPLAPAPVAVDAPPPPAPPPAPRRPLASVTLGGIVYTSVFNPSDGRKNWSDIVTGFCWAFREVADATLVLKMIKGDWHVYRHELFIMLAQLAPFKCRVVALDGFLEDDDYARLIEATSFYVNASKAEGLCLPLMEFMALGKPAIAPRHTAMEDYIDPSVAFIVQSSPEHNVWPHDPRPRFTTMRHRIHWDTLVDAFAESYRVATTEPERYRAMAMRAAEVIRAYSADAVVREQLRAVVDRMIADRVRPVQPEADAIPAAPAVLEAVSP